ncbi:Predicted arabinose efflux permease, MFS family [Alteribacillus bidgolensis]|uniref:Predicted arabinose efflux permease, MFS family n=1 Tax=Alteribacillus bidgolensis TaxID=930129 RepID=A0A1G8MGJ4_9BACI|nr:MFS transporter [Alteribacillus bidgolensis]SDI67051.1 Predicted arabinose efflux permease, MFS family [Alteribacillus bidgolensis]
MGTQKNVVIGNVSFCVATALTGIAETFTVLMIFRILSGIGAGMIEPGVYAIVGDHYSYAHRGRAMGVVTGALISASIIGVPIGGYIAQWFTWRWTFWLIGLISLVTIIAIWISIPKDPRKEKVTNQPIKGLFNQFGTAFSNTSVFFALLATLLYFGGLQGMFANVGVFYDLNYGLTSGQIGLVLMVAGIGSVIGSVVGGQLADRFGKKSTILSSSIIVAVSVFALSIITKSFITAILINVVWATVYGLGQSALTALISELSPTVRGTVMSLNSSAMYAGSGLFTAIAATLLYGGSFLWVGILCGVANIIVFLTVFVVNEQTSRIPESADSSSQL